MLGLLHRYAETDLDQCGALRFTTRYGEVYFLLSRKPIPDAPPDWYIDVDHLLDRPARRERPNGAHGEGPPDVV
jgi:hypothetical protein